MIKLFLPRAKYQDSIIVFIDNEYKELLVDEVRGIIIDKKLSWIYYPYGKSGQLDAITDEDILMNLTTQTIYTDTEKDKNDFLKI